MKITKSDVQTIIASATVQDKVTAEEFRGLLMVCRLAVLTGTESELLAAYDEVNNDGPDYNGPAVVDTQSVMRDVRNMVPPAAPVIHEVEPELSGVTLEFFGPDENVPKGCTVKMPVRFNALPADEKSAILARLDTAKSILGTCIKQYEETGSLPPLVTRNGQTFREFATNLLNRSAEF